MKMGVAFRSLTLTVLITLGLLTPLLTIPRNASAYIPHAPIQITADWDFTAANGVTGGSGTLGDPFMIEGWEISGFPEYGIHVYGTTAHFIIRDVYVHSGPGNWYAVYLNGAANAHIWNSTITTSDIGIRIRNCENVTLVDNDVSQILGSGLSVYLATNLTISNNRVRNNSHGLTLASSDGVLISGNRFVDNRQTGILYFPSTDVLISGNNISNSQYNGVSVSHGEGLIIEDNEFYNIYGGAGIRTYESTNCIFRGNTFSYSKYGVNLGYLSQGNRIYHNNFIFNTIPGDNRNALTSNYWDNGYPSGGNYWSNYTGIDNCRGVDQNICPSPDGIGDIPNPIDPTSIADYYPLTGPYVDRVPPTVSITSPNDGAVFDFSPVNVAGTASDPGGGEIRAVEVRANTGTWKMATGTASWTTSVSLKQGSNLIEARSWDYAGNPSVVDSISVVYNPPVNNPPVASFTVSPSTGNVTMTFTVDASSSSDPEDPVSVLEVRWDWEDNGIWDTTWSTTKTATQKYTEEGTYTITLQVRDTGGMTDETSEQVIVEALIPPQNEPPTCGIMDPISGTEISGTYAIEGTASDADGNVQIVEIKIDGGPWIATEGTSSWTHIWNTSLVDDGQHTIQARSFDGEDYSGLVSMTVLVDNAEPPPDGQQDGFLTSSVIVWMSIVIAVVVLLILIVFLLLGGRRRVDEEPHGQSQEEHL